MPKKRGEKGRRDNDPSIKLSFAVSVDVCAVGARNIIEDKVKTRIAQAYFDGYDIEQFSLLEFFDIPTYVGNLVILLTIYPKGDGLHIMATSLDEVSPNALALLQAQPDICDMLNKLSRTPSMAKQLQKALLAQRHTFSSN